MRPAHDLTNNGVDAKNQADGPRARRSAHGVRCMPARARIILLASSGNAATER
jgi:hypothetical protein